MTALTTTEAADLAALEATIERGLGTFVEVGEALARIRDERKYRASHGTFEAYCRERWGFTDRRARQMMDAAEAVAAIGTTVPEVAPPANEAQARELAPLRDQPETMAAAWTAATEAAQADGTPITAERVRAAVEMTKADRDHVDGVAAYGTIGAALRARRNRREEQAA